MKSRGKGLQEGLQGEGVKELQGGESEGDDSFMSID